MSKTDQILVNGYKAVHPLIAQLVDDETILSHLKFKKVVSRAIRLEKIRIAHKSLGRGN